MTTSTKLSVVAAFLLSATSLLGAPSTASAACWGCCGVAPPAPPSRIHIFCVRPTSVNDPILWGGGSLGWIALQDSFLQNTRHYPHGPDPLKGQYEIAVWCPSCVAPPAGRPRAPGNRSAD
jgi:hypothetical protein